MFEHELDRYWRTVANTISDGIMVVDEQGIIIYVNEAFEGITGFSKDEMVGRGIKHAGTGYIESTLVCVGLCFLKILVSPSLMSTNWSKPFGTITTPWSGPNIQNR